MLRLRPHFDVLPDAQRTVWGGLRHIRTLGWVLYGGTAIALRLGHRASVDATSSITRRSTGCI